MAAYQEITTRQVANFAPSTTAVQIAWANPRLAFRELANYGSVDVYFSGTAVVSSSGAQRGTRLPANSSTWLPDLSNGDLFAITASGTGDVHVVSHVSIR